ncbi:MAG: hypothetical protein H0U17_04290 [Actinobacteria bacterium]|jgi:hypothetical protein|nr:hypothetical protein [Actinomycetota bacterium]
MSNGVKWSVGACLALALVVSLFGTFDYARDTARRPELAPTPEDDDSSSPSRLDRSRRGPRPLPLQGPSHLLMQLRKIGFKEAILLPGERPRRLTLSFSGDQDVSARTFYEVNGRLLSIAQIYGAPLPEAGTIVKLSSRRAGIVVGDVIYWSERGYLVAIPEESRALITRLRWRPVA